MEKGKNLSLTLIKLHFFPVDNANYFFLYFPTAFKKALI